MISENKLKHMLGVARRCEFLAKENGMSEDAQKACFVMGLLHDIGYENGVIDGHPVRGFDYAEAFLSFPDALDAIKKHGKPIEGDVSLFDIILNTADLTTNYIGNLVSIEDRLEGITERHSASSTHYLHALETANFYNLFKGEDDNE